MAKPEIGQFPNWPTTFKNEWPNEIGLFANRLDVIGQFTKYL